MDRGVRGARCAAAPSDVAAVDQLPRGRDDVVGAARVRGGEVFAQERARAARPEEEADAEADREADRDVLDADDPTRQPTGWMMLKRMKSTTVKPGLAGGERDRTRRVGREQDRDRQHGPEHGFVRADADHEQRADDDPDRGAGERA